jgi:hypothetical protein
VYAHEATEFVSKSSDAGRDSTIKAATLRLREPPLNRVEPGGTGRSGVHVDPWVGGEEVLHSRCLVRAAVVQDQMNLQFLRHASTQSWRWINADLWAFSVILYAIGTQPLVST